MAPMPRFTAEPPLSRRRTPPRAGAVAVWIRAAALWALSGLSASAALAQGQDEEELLPPPNPAEIGQTTRTLLEQSIQRVLEHLRQDRPDLLSEVSGFGALNANAFLQQDRNLRRDSRAFRALAVERVGPWGQLSCAEIARRLDVWRIEDATQPWQRDARWWLNRIEGALGAPPEFADEEREDDPEAAPADDAAPESETESEAPPSPLEIELENLRALEALFAERPFLRLRPDSVFSADHRLQVSAAIDRFAERRIDLDQPWPKFGAERWRSLHAKALEAFRATLDDLPNGEREDRTGAGRLNSGGWLRWVAALFGRPVEALELERALLHGLLYLERFPNPDPRIEIDLDALRGELIATVPPRSARRLPATNLDFEVHPAEPAPRVGWSQQDGTVRLVHRPQVNVWAPARLGVERVLLGELAGSLAHACDLRPDYEGFEWRLVPDPVGCEALALAMGYEALRRVEEPLPHHLVLAQALRVRWADALFVLSWHGHLEERLERLREALARRREQSPGAIAADVEGLRREPRQALPASLAALWVDGWAEADEKQRTLRLERQWLSRLGPQ